DSAARTNRSCRHRSPHSVPTRRSSDLVSDHEYEELEQTANNFHMSVPAFAKKRALGYRMKPPKVDKSGAIEIAKQLRAIGNNVNQLTKRANASNGKIDSEEL